MLWWRNGYGFVANKVHNTITRVSAWYCQGIRGPGIDELIPQSGQ